MVKYPKRLGWHTSTETLCNTGSGIVWRKDHTILNPDTGEELLFIRGRDRGISKEFVDGLLEQIVQRFNLAPVTMRETSDSLDLDVTSPESVAKVLREAAQKYRESVGELASAWGDPEAGKVWGRLACVLERAANSCDKIC